MLVRVTTSCTTIRASDVMAIVRTPGPRVTVTVSGAESRSTALTVPTICVEPPGVCCSSPGARPTTDEITSTRSAFGS